MSDWLVLIIIISIIILLLLIIIILIIIINIIMIIIIMAYAGTAVSDWLLLVISRFLRLTVPPLTLKKRKRQR